MTIAVVDKKADGAFARRVDLPVSPRISRLINPPPGRHAGYGDEQPVIVIEAVASARWAAWACTAASGSLPAGDSCAQKHRPGPRPNGDLVLNETCVQSVLYRLLRRHKEQRELSPDQDPVPVKRHLVAERPKKGH